MNGWFTVEKIDAQTFAISEYRHWEETHCYLLCGQDKSVLIDTGLGVSNIKRIVDSLTTLPVMPSIAGFGIKCASCSWSRQTWIGFWALKKMVPLKKRHHLSCISVVNKQG